MKIKVLDLFSGIGGFTLGLNNTGKYETKQFVEIDPYCQAVLQKNFPGTPIHDDITTYSPDQEFDMICGGFPCQDISIAGKGLGLKGERSGLWAEFKRIIREVGPSFVLIENVSALRTNGLVTVLQDLCEIGYDAEWYTISAAHFGSPQRRERVWVIAYLTSDRRERLISSSDIEKVRQRWTSSEEDLQFIVNYPFRDNRWPKPLIRRVDGRIPFRMDRLKGLGNSVYPKIVEFIGEKIWVAKNKRKRLVSNVVT